MSVLRRLFAEAWTRTVATICVGASILHRGASAVQTAAMPSVRPDSYRWV